MAVASTTAFAGAPSYTTSAGYTPAQLVDLLVPSGSGINVILGSQNFTGPLGINSPGSTVANTIYGTVGSSGVIGTSGTLIAPPEQKTSTGAFVGGSSVNLGPASTTGRTGIPFDTGLVMSTGLLSTSNGTTTDPNNSNSTSKSWQLFGTAGSPLLESVIPSTSGFTADSSTLSFRFTLDPGVSAFKFQYAFGSEEYLEFVGSEFNDAFAFVLTDLNTLTSVNLATIGSAPVSVNSVNGGANSAFYANNAFVSTSGGSTFLSEYDGIAGGFGVNPLFAISPVDFTHVYQIDLVIADVGDTRYDSAVFLAGGSFTRTELPPTVPEPSTYVGALALAGLVARRLRRKA